MQTSEDPGLNPPRTGNGLNAKRNPEACHKAGHWRKSLRSQDPSPRNPFRRSWGKLCLGSVMFCCGAARELLFFATHIKGCEALVRGFWLVSWGFEPLVLAEGKSQTTRNTTKPPIQEPTNTPALFLSKKRPEVFGTRRSFLVGCDAQSS